MPYADQFPIDPIPSRRSVRARNSPKLCPLFRPIPPLRRNPKTGRRGIRRRLRRRAKPRASPLPRRVQARKHTLDRLRAPVRARDLMVSAQRSTRALISGSCTSKSAARSQTEEAGPWVVFVHGSLTTRQVHPQCDKEAGECSMWGVVRVDSDADMEARTLRPKSMPSSPRTLEFPLTIWWPAARSTMIRKLRR